MERIKHQSLPMNPDCSLIHKETTEKIIGGAMAVLNALGPGLDEKIYENALVAELEALDAEVSQQENFPVVYRGKEIGRLIPDLIVNGEVLVETKVAESFAQAHEAQILGYLAITNLRVGLWLNFKHARLQWKRLVR
jgi:GxxExxY protein